MLSFVPNHFFWVCLKTLLCTHALLGVVGLANVRVICAKDSSSHNSLGFVAGSSRPDGNAQAVEVPGGWMVVYQEKIPGTQITFDMVPIPGGTFRMGSPDSEADRDSYEGPMIEIRIEPLWMGRCEVTWAEYKNFMSACDLFKALQTAGIRIVTPDNIADAVTAPSNLYDPTTTFSKGEDPQQPAVTMTQFSARQYTKWLTGLTARFYRIPSESEWEYACRAGTLSAWSTGDDAASLEKAAWFADNSDDTTHHVGTLSPNAWGLHDMHGNVCEWVLDQRAEDGYAVQSLLPKPIGSFEAIRWPTSLSPRVVRGGTFYDEAAQCRSAARRGSEDLAWKDIDPNLPKSPWWYTEEPALGVGMRLVRPYAEPDIAIKRRWWNADIESIRDDAEDRLLQGRGGRGLVDPALPADAKAAGFGG